MVSIRNITDRPHEKIGDIYTIDYIYENGNYLVKDSQGLLITIHHVDDVIPWVKPEIKNVSSVWYGDKYTTFVDYTDDTSHHIITDLSGDKPEVKTEYYPASNINLIKTTV